MKTDERTVVIIKPHVFSDPGGVDNVLNIIKRYTALGLNIVTCVSRWLNQQEVERLYYQHLHRSFFYEISHSMMSGECVILVLAGENAVAVVRNLNGATDPADAEKGTLRKQFGKNKTNNAVHGSESAKAAETEMAVLNLYAYDVSPEVSLVRIGLSERLVKADLFKSRRDHQPFTAPISDNKIVAGVYGLPLRADDL